MIHKERLLELFNEKPSVRIKESIIALEEFEGFEDCFVDMTNFHKISVDTYFDKKPGSCFACLGGASAMIRFGLDNEEVLGIESRFSLLRLITNDRDAKNYNNYHQLICNYENSLDSARVGNIKGMLEHMNIKTRDLKLDFHVTPYEDDIAKWKEEILEIADYLELEGL